VSKNWYYETEAMILIKRRGIVGMGTAEEKDGRLLLSGFLKSFSEIIRISDEISTPCS
jgi:hypothetical protein